MPRLSRRRYATLAEVQRFFAGEPDNPMPRLLLNILPLYVVTTVLSCAAAISMARAVFYAP